MQRRDILKLGCMLGMGWSLNSVCIAQVQNLNDAINKSGRQRMLTQRLAKAYLQIGMGVDLDQSRKILDSSASLFDRQLIELKNFKTTAEIKDGVLRTEKTWLTYKDLLLGKAANPGDAKQVLLLSDSLLAMADQVTQQLEKHANSVAGKLVNMAGRQRMLSQRMAKMYQAIQWEVADASMLGSLELARKEFNGNMRILESHADTTKQIQTELKFARQQWAYFDHAIQQSPDVRTRQQYANTVATTSERILQQMDIVTGLYQVLS
ncbi:type IV pili methyl-accepting chemotaxis transducer N-terminal domain-containing protein [Undibacterium amnicola]|uniref:Type IV pili methyl-accepting chemotaxis transducer N-terminal domain-containing protein n=1 Tax=Undibacterium amnicola TaxID=1834038 RepID=A0ABR6XTP0_9BURK|nr:type IV pili methyl-accepting chemotaxis transducer N-terminal domain-containing protein [Undibacterium amnicola]MBC3832817.1 type IV pili methyl-accepting chemotaxis transducer N-terminal domain-containing protein [Undibacterium amnicola]